MLTQAPEPPSATLARARAGLASRFGAEAEWIATAPGRVNLIGEHVDYSDGLVLPIAIDRWAVAAAGAARDGKTRIFAIDLDRVVTEDDGSALASIVRRFTAIAGAVPALDVAITSDVLRGAGLSSSAAVEVALATALEAAAGRRLDPRDKARLCRQAEHDAGVPCGIMDMYVATRAEPGCALLIDCASLESRAIPLPPPERLSVVVVDTGVDRSLGATAYADRRAACANVAGILGVPSLRHADRAMLDDAALPEVDRRRAVHVIDENDRTRRAVQALDGGDLLTFGDLMFASHESLRDRYEVSCPELDTVVATAREIRDGGGGVFGARMTGAGFGGCAIVACAGDAVGDASGRIRAAFRSAHGRDVDPFVVRAVGGCSVVTNRPSRRTAR